MAALSIPSLLDRCKSAIIKYIADEALRGNLPFPRFVYPGALASHIFISHRAREDELLYILRKLLELRLWPGTLWAAMSDAPSTHCVQQPGESSCSRGLTHIHFSLLTAIDSSLPPSELIADAVKRSSVAHLFRFYHDLCNIASIPRKTPSAWIMAEAPSPSSSSPSPGGEHDDADASRGKIGTSVSNGKALELDARSLARECLKTIGQELGMGLSL